MNQWGAAALEVEAKPSCPRRQLGVPSHSEVTDPPSPCSVSSSPALWDNRVTLSFASEKLHELIPLMKFPWGRAYNCSVHWAEENAVFKVPSWKFSVTLMASKHFGKLTLASWIYLCLKPKTIHKLKFLSFLKMYLFLTLPSQWY